MIKFFSKYIGDYKKYIYFIPLAVLSEICCELLIPLLMSNIVDIGIDTQKIQYILNIGLIMIVLVILAILFGCILIKCATLAGQGFAYNIRTELFNKIQQASSFSKDEFSAETITSIITDDVETIQNSFFSLYVLIRAAFMLICAFILAFIMNAPLAMIISITLPIAAFVFSILAKKAYNLYWSLQEKLNALSHALQNMLSARVKEKNIQNKNEKLKTAEQDVKSAEVKASAQSVLFMPILMFIINAATIVILWYGGNMVSESTLGTGKLIGFISYMLQIFICIAQIYFVFSLVIKSKASGARIKGIMDAAVNSAVHSPPPGQPCGKLPNAVLQKEKTSALPGIKNHPRGYARPKNTKNVLTRLYRFLDHGAPYLIVIVLMIIISTASELEGSYYLKPLINDYIIPGNLRGFAGALIVLGLIYVAGGLASYGQTRLMTTITQKAANKMREKLFDKLQTSPGNKYDANTSGYIIECCTNDVENLRMAFEQNAAQLISNILGFLGILVMMIILSPVLFCAIIMVIVLMIILTGKIGKKSWEHFLSQQKSQRRLNAYVRQTAEGLKDINAYNNKQAVKKDFEKLNKTYRISSAKANFYSGIILPIMGNLNNMCYAAATLFGGLLSVLSRFDIGSLASFLQYSRQVGQPVEQITAQINSLLSAMAGAERIFDLIDKL